VSVTAAKGFRAGSVEAGLAARGGADFTIVVNDGPSDAAAAVFTTNRATAHPIRWSKVAIVDGVARAVVLNAGGANCFTGPEGFTLTHRTAEVTAESLSADAVARGLPEVSASDVLVCSTGLIGEPLPAGAVMAAIPLAVGQLESTEQAGELSSQAIMTTDSVPKRVVKLVESDSGSYTIGGMAKGAGMLAPGLATMLVVITTDAQLTAAHLDRALRAATRVSFDRLDSDGCMSTNDQVTLMASGASGVSPDEASFTEALTDVCLSLAMGLLADAEGASHNIAIEVTGAPSEDDAVVVARSVARNNLFKAAVFGNDPNWGRVLAAIGTAPVEFDPDGVDISMNGVRVCHKGTPDRSRTEVDLTPRETHVLIELNSGRSSATVWTNDLTHDYVHENSAYSS
jgi:glutamate N-acetyltransferase/amino-acid N-acetyltransferase